MNEDRKNVVPSDKAQLKEILKSELEQVLQSLKVGNIPNNEAIAELQRLFLSYICACESSKEKLSGEPLLARDSNRRITLWKDILPDTEQPIEFDDSILNEREAIKILKSFVLQKMIMEMQLSESGTLWHYLQNIGFITRVKLNDCCYWVLTSRGWQWLAEKETKQLLAEKDESFILADKLVPDITLWSDSSFHQMDMIRKYYDANGITQFMIFSDQEQPNVFLGCEIRDSYAVSYCVAIDSESKIKATDAVRIYDLGKSDRIDNLTVVVRSQDEENRLKIKRGLDVRELNKLQFYILTEEKVNEMA